jgi:hypothetical protein
MNEKAVALIIGAGGSVPFGFLTGEQLKWAIVDGLHGVEVAHDAAANVSEFASKLLKEDFSVDELCLLRDRLGTSGWTSVDEFLAEHKDLQIVGKAAIAGILLPCENRDQLFDPRDPKGNRIANWYQLLFRAIFSPFEEILRRNVVIFTYNYDCSLETYLKETMKNSYERPEHDVDTALKHVRIVHLHGEFTSHKYAPESMSVSLRKCSEAISIVTDNLDDSPQFKQVIDTLWKAEEIYFIGFGYDEKNLARLPIESKYPPGSTGSQLNEKRPSLNVFGSAYRVGPGVSRRVQDYFKHRGFNIQLGDTDQDAYQFLRSTVRFGNQ